MALPSQPSFVPRSMDPERSWSWGSGIAPATPRAVRAGPEARIRRDSDPDVPAPPTTNPAMRMLDPVSACARVDMLTSLPMSLVELIDTVAGLLVADPTSLPATQV